MLVVVVIAGLTVIVVVIIAILVVIAIILRYWYDTAECAEAWRLPVFVVVDVAAWQHVVYFAFSVPFVAEHKSVVAAVAQVVQPQPFSEGHCFVPTAFQRMSSPASLFQAALLPLHPVFWLILFLLQRQILCLRLK